ncbi:sensor histidine kinase [Anaerocolumna xylanovorans]|uniref:histidine kinase n=1 Tax=Anaerocolumna xylanovorans DSM 12503 TaxID=1121345 RepID=A0A1M7XWF5_9FIRM|nr:HAMP domain-containing sensor histidine kinase [Anaerocolumna xylanovorans]SHO42967.1 Signal transduction histidine kinase [Anaerocolumna xylanovorans DSM 12503]
MKLSWKIFRNTILLVFFALSLGGTIMISMTLKHSISSEIMQEKKEIQSMQRDMAVLMANDSRTLYLEESKVLELVIETLNENWRAEGRQFRIRDKEGKILAYSGNNPFVDMESPGENKLKYTIYQEQKLYYMQMTLAVKFTNDTVILDKCTNITSIFSLRNTQLRFFFIIMLSVGILCAVLNFLNMLWISKTLYQLQDTVVKMQQGDLKARVHSNSDDEIGVLAESFNNMADRLEKDILELKEEARRQEEFVGSFAHEIRTPLTSIIGYADLLRRKQLEETAYFTATNYIFTEGKRLEGLSVKLLDLLVVKSAVRDYTVLSIRKLLEDSIGTMQSLLDEKEITVVRELDELNVRADEQLMKTVLINLMDNARKAVDIAGRIRIEAKAEGKKVRITVSDNGRGIPTEEIPKIQEAFYRVDKSRSRKEGGVGLGLAICANIMKLHGGEIQFESGLAKGTKVTLLWEGAVNEAQAK